MNEAQEKSIASHEAQDFVPYRLRAKPCSACRQMKPRSEFPKKQDGGYAERCRDCRDAGRRAKPKDVIRISIERSKKAWRSKKKMEAADVAS